MPSHILQAIPADPDAPNANSIRCGWGYRVYVNLETKEKMYSGGDVEHMCPKDGYVCFRNSQLLCGRLGKATLGGGNKAGLFQVRSHQPECFYQCRGIVLTTDPSAS